MGSARTGPCAAGRWYVVHTHPHREAGAARHLANQGFNVFVPLRSKTRRHARRIETVKVAYFPCYLFIHLDIAREAWRSVNGTVSVRYLLTRGERPDPVPEGMVEALIAHTDGTGLLLMSDDLKNGEHVRIAGGPFGEFIGTLEHLGPNNRVHVLLETMGGARVTLPKDRVTPLSR